MKQRQRVCFRKKANSINTAIQRNVDKTEHLNFLKRRLRNAIENETLNELKEILFNRSHLNQLNKYYAKNYMCTQNVMIDLEANDSESMEMGMDSNSVEREKDLATDSNRLNSYRSRRRSIYKRYHNNHLINWSHLSIEKYGFNALHYATHLNRLCVIDILLDSGYFNIENKTNSEEKNTPLMIACDDGSLDMIKLLISRGANVNYENRKNRTPLILATESKSPYDYEMVQILLSNGADVNKKTSNGNTVLLSAAKFGDYKLIDYLLNFKNIHIDCAYNDGATPLMRACYFNYPEIATLLVEKGANLEAKNLRNETPLYIASFRGFVNIVKILVEKYNASLNEGDIDGDTPLCVACYENQPDIVTYLLRKGSNVNVHGVRMDTPLHVAVSNCDLETVQELIRFGAKIDQVNKDNETPLHIVTKQDRIHILDYLLEHAKELDTISIYGKTPFRNVIDKIQIEKLALGISLIKAGCDVNKTFNNEKTINFSPFSNLFKLSKSRFQFYQLVHLSNQNEHSNGNNYILVSQVENTPLKFYIRLIELIIHAGYRLTFDDYKLYTQSWLFNYLKNNDVKTNLHLENLFLLNGLRRPRSLIDLCRLRIRSILKKPIQSSINRLQIPHQLKPFLHLD